MTLHLPSRGQLLFVLAFLTFLLLFLFPVKVWLARMGLRWLYILLFSFLLAFLLVRPIRAFARRWGIVDLPDERKRHGEPTPLLGGVAIALAFTGSLLANAILAPPLWGMLFAGTLILLMGLLDDVHPLPSLLKLSLFLLSALVVIASGIAITLFPVQTLWGQLLNWLLTILWVVGITNAMNFFDGMDGLAAGLAAIASIFLGIIAYQSQQVFLGWVAAALLGSTLGFLPYNFRPGRRATIFLGDAGSNFLGFILACLAILGEWAEHELVKVTAPLFIFGVFIYDMSYITVDRIASGKVKSFKEWIEYVGRDHLHHRLEELFGRQEEAVLFIYALSVTLSLGATVLLMASSPLVSVFLIVQALVLLLMVTLLERRGRQNPLPGQTGGPSQGSGGEGMAWRVEGP